MRISDGSITGKTSLNTTINNSAFDNISQDTSQLYIRNSKVLTETIEEVLIRSGVGGILLKTHILMTKCSVPFYKL